MTERGRLEIRVLGRLDACDGGVEVDLGGRRQRAVLAVLVLARGDVVPAERIADCLWGEELPANAGGAVQSYVSHLRRRLQPEGAPRSRGGIIVSHGVGYAVRLGADDVDAWRFERLVRDAAAPGQGDPRRTAALLTEALELWRGPALVEYAGEPWAEAEIARLTELREVARERLLAARLDAGEAALLVPELEALVADQPLREERWRLLVLALYRAHRQADALAALRRARTVLADELGIDPGPALRSLEREVLAQSPTLAATVPVPASAADQHDVPPRLPPARAPEPEPEPEPAPAAALHDLVDRDGELAAVRAAVADVAAGLSQFVLIEGPPGVGKTRLLAETRRLAAEHGLPVLGARGSQLERAFGFGAVRQMFEPVLVDQARREQLLAGAAASARGVFDVPDAAAEGTFAVLHGLYWLTAGLASERPLVLTVDDLQWCDTCSLRFLGYLARRLDGVPLLIAATLRTGERHEHEDLLAELLLDPSATTVRPRPLTRDGTAELIRRRLGEPAPLFVTACHTTTAGNPLLLRQLLRALEADRVRPDASHADRVMACGSRAIASMVLVRLRRLPAEATSVARAVAVLGDRAELPAVAELAELDEIAAVSALADLAGAEILRDEDPIGFVHPLVRDAVYRAVPGAERALAHERAARVLRWRGAAAEHVAAHLLLAPARGDAGTVAVLREAARTMAGRGAAENAVTYLRRALAEPAEGEARLEVLRALGLLETLVDGPAGLEHLGAAYDLVTDPAARAELALPIAWTHVFTSSPGVASAFAQEAAASLPADLTDARQGLLALQRISGFMQGVDPALWRAGPDPIVQGEGDGARMLAATLAWEVACAGADRGRAVELARFALREDRLLAVDSGLFWVVAANARMLADDDLGDFWERARAQAHARGSLFTALSVNLWQGLWQWRRGELAEAVACFEAMLEQDRMWGGSGTGRDYALSFLVAAHVDSGDLAAARSVAEDALAGASGGEGRRLVRHAVARLRLAEGRWSDALTLLDGSGDPALGGVNPAWNTRLGLRAAALAGLGRRDEALALQEDELVLLRRWGAPSFLGAGLRRLGELAGAAGLEHLREAMDVLSTTTAELERARAELALGRSADVADREALPLLRAAAERARRCGAQRVFAEACTALQDRGEVVEDSACDVDPPVSSTVRRILELAGAGLGVHEVAQKLFLTPGTVRAALEHDRSSSAQVGRGRVEA
ncbi:MAG TPA: BTAD domain-containing putative transcriptional regulator [Kineosporiaceae bacterium]|nr:BTAD domain-containing putative transcriptional regulator [Kineosporiaceae bacterium]